jgi:hypothetical protein
MNQAECVCYEQTNEVLAEIVGESRQDEGVKNEGRTNVLKGAWETCFPYYLGAASLLHYISRSQAMQPIRP